MLQYLNETDYPSLPEPRTQESCVLYEINGLLSLTHIIIFIKKPVSKRPAMVLVRKVVFKTD